MENEKLKVPELPEGYFFRVEKSKEIYIVRVSLRKKELFYSVEEDYYLSLANSYEVGRTMNQLCRELHHRLKSASSQSALCGDYPPKTLG